MFGFVVADAEALSDEEKERYRSLYCGLCFALRDRYGQLSRACLTYDLTFFVLLANSLHEPAEASGASHCVMHPAPAAARPWSRSPWTDYAADLSVALAYHKALDDVADDGSAKARTAARLLAGAYERAQARIPRQCVEIERAMAAIRAIEQEDAEADPDATAREFGILLGRLFAHNQGFWTEGMEALGCALGRFIYLMDAAVDFTTDAQSGSYNPFVTLGATPETMRTTLALAAADAAEAYERLPLVQDAHLMDAILYSGVWAQLNKTYPVEAATGQSRGDPPSESPRN